MCSFTYVLEKRKVQVYLSLLLDLRVEFSGKTVRINKNKLINIYEDRINALNNWTMKRKEKKKKKKEAKE